jgi:hypothetical protein
MHFYRTCPSIICIHSTSEVTHTLGQVLAKSLCPNPIPGTDGPIERLHYLFWYVLKVYLICRLLADRAQTTVAVELFSWTHLPNNYWSDRKGVDQGATGKCFDGCMPTFVPYYVNHLHVHGSSCRNPCLECSHWMEEKHHPDIKKQIHEQPILHAGWRSSSCRLV